MRFMPARGPGPPGFAPGSRRSARRAAPRSRARRRGAIAPSRAGTHEVGSCLPAMLGLIKTPDPRYGGAPDPDDERERRWEPISRRISVPVFLSIMALIISPQTPVAVSVLLNIAAIALCAYAVRQAWPQREGEAPGRDDG
jgi:hypothetical protein